MATPEPVLPTIALSSHTKDYDQPLVSTLAGTISARCFEENFFGKLVAGKSALGIGPGLTTQPETQEFVRGVMGMRSRVPIILDADGLNAFAGRASELRDSERDDRLDSASRRNGAAYWLSTEEVQARRVELANKCAADWNAQVILKGHHTVIAVPDGSSWINSTGNPGMGTGGTGDVLTGLLAGLTAQYRTRLGRCC